MGRVEKLAQTPQSSRAPGHWQDRGLSKVPVLEFTVDQNRYLKLCENG